MLQSFTGEPSLWGWGCDGWDKLEIFLKSRVELASNEISALQELITKTLKQSYFHAGLVTQWLLSKFLVVVGNASGTTPKESMAVNKKKNVFHLLLFENLITLEWDINDCLIERIKGALCTKCFHRCFSESRAAEFERI